MSFDLNSLQCEYQAEGNPVIKVFGVGGGGGNVINRMIQDGVTGVEYIAVNTDAMVLNSSYANKTIPLGQRLTKGLGAGMKPEIGRLAAEEDQESIIAAMQDADLIFIAAGLGGGTGTGAAAVIAELAKKRDILTIGVVTTPFKFEGKKRGRIAEKGITELAQFVDTLMVIPNNRLIEIASKQTTITEAFALVDDVLKQGIGGITRLINLEGTINLDFADLKTVIQNKGRALMGIGRASGDDRGYQAAKKAISSPLLSNMGIEGATGIIVNIMADEAFTLLDAQNAVAFLEEKGHPDADVIFGLVYDKKKKSEVSINVIATGFIGLEAESQQPPKELQNSATVGGLGKLQDQEIKIAADNQIIETRDQPFLNLSSPKSQDEILELDPEIFGLKEVEKELFYPNTES